MNKYFFGDKALSGFARQQIDENGELKYKGCIYLFGSYVPIYLSLEPHDKYVKGEKVYKVFTYLTPIPAERKRNMFYIPARHASTARLKAIRKVEKIVKELGVSYDYYRCNKEKEDKQRCKACKKEIESEWRERLREAVSSNVERQRNIRKRQVQKLLARRVRY